ncbi:hypothetical protein BN1723_011726 [Verticillium longisporum]|uniref:peptidylprolyl isomerase n=3 Tax=Verticillium TaxID=1036719 RepID=G2X886_VERDV|nr:FK506-binding protein [Verticillium dahliae VdLs.17]KAF3342393.1 Polyol transporter 5 [Verticillium dahliae VDG2]KAH6697808.1 FK506-binding protein [Verticillium dahliae]CRK18938.1 hypothetical protein BN1723_011726 [Verticillium longisporum]EGY15173.1 FK506-binding protein [Verticillium dahliae VdLs.17]PNH35940.1 hypothetical protein BJF96_g730 [Verticillium dahliae]
MQGALLSFGLLASTAFSFVAADGLKIDKTLEVECERKTVKGDRISVHYRGSLQDGGKEFDASYNRGQPFNVKIGAGQVIKGWEEGLLDMCIGEKRTLTIPSDMGYGPRGMGPIPGGATLIFETELMGIEGVEKPEKIVVKLPKEEEAKEEVKEKAEEAAEGIAQKVASVVGEAAEAVKTVVADGTDDNQEHNEL